MFHDSVHVCYVIVYSILCGILCVTCFAVLTLNDCRIHHHNLCTYYSRATDSTKAIIIYEFEGIIIYYTLKHYDTTYTIIMVHNGLRHNTRLPLTFVL